jgi:serralysin
MRDARLGGSTSDSAQTYSMLADPLTFDAAPLFGTSSASAIAQASAGVDESPSADGLAMIGFLTGETAAGGLVSQSFASWDGQSPAGYSGSNGIAANWGKGAVVTYAFNLASNYSAAEQSVYLTALTLWHDVANISFVAASSYGVAQIQFIRTSDGQANTSTSYSIPANVSRPGTLLSATVGIDTSVSSFADPTSFTSYGGYAKEVVQHEIGHALGLGHPGTYDGSNPSAGQILFASDTRQYTVMSYNDPAANKYQGQVLTTPGQYDILALQRIYGAPTSSGLSGGQVFGFNGNTGLDPYDFSKNIHPVVTLFDTGDNNTLDLSGFTQAETVDLNPGGFSSADGMRDNIGIDFSTKIDHFIGGSGDDVIIVNNNSDVIDGGGGSNTVSFNAALANAALTAAAGTVTATIGSATYTLRNIQTLKFADTTITAGSIACFVAGTLIATPAGEMPVEALRQGDLVRLHDGRLAPISWIGRCAVTPEPGAEPLHIAADAFGPGQPYRRLTLSPEHAVFAEGVLIPVRCLENGHSVRKAALERVVYFHIRLEGHEILRAQGLAVESWLDDGARDGFDNAADAPEFRPMQPAHPMRRQGLEVERVRLTLHENLPKPALMEHAA